ncbi:hypothetical protein KI387_033505 [Taxus chinensis]|uniref:DUF7796 domain-containing protein n=1 Tax=Taxus chinensis TaxID=29808 RepID=A0AA38F4J9_TAXCH|nr:hypothetical protein KI387_033505 [Taxus chinensis]
MGRWLWIRKRQWFGLVLLLGLAGILCILQMEIIPISEQPFLPLITVQAHLYNYVHVHAANGVSEKNSTQTATKKNRTAICLIGGARKFELTGPSLLEYVVNMYNNSDVFLHAPLDNDTYKFSVLKEASSGLAEVRIFTPQRINETTLQAEVFTSNGSPNGLQGLLQYFNLVEGCLTMIKSYQTKHNVEYDWIVRTRVDGYWNGPLPSPETYSNKSYIVPVGSEYKGLNDRLGIGDMETSEAALSRISLIPLLHESGYRKLNSEAAFQHQLDVKGVNYTLKTFPFCILSEHKYIWPIPSWGVPVASISSKEDLNGAYCRPCTPVLKGTGAMTYIEKRLRRPWSWIVPTPGIELCNARDEWKENWEHIFDEAAGPKFSAVRHKFKNYTVTDCIIDFEALKQKTTDWDAPPPETICNIHFQHSQID